MHTEHNRALLDSLLETGSRNIFNRRPRAENCPGVGIELLAGPKEGDYLLQR